MVCLSPKGRYSVCLPEVSREMTGNRKSLRIANYDYATPGSYFVTICLENRTPILSQIDGAGAHPTSIGVMISEV